jgi:hypothetical protein
MNVTFRTNATGTWANIGSNNSIYNGTYSQTNSSMNNYNTTYWWSVNVTDGTLWTNVTYNFTTVTQTLYERYNTGDTGAWGFEGNDWSAQTFTVGNTGTNESHQIISVKLKMYKVGTPGTVTVGIRTTNETGMPTGEDLINGTINGDTFTTDEAGEWYEITLTSYTLSAGTKYSIVVRCTGVQLCWCYDATSPAYTGGIFCYSSNAGATWTSLDRDFMFEEYGII